jgi:hypothetical protein
LWHKHFSVVRELPPGTGATRCHGDETTVLDVHARLQAIGQLPDDIGTFVRHAASVAGNRVRTTAATRPMWSSPDR